MSSTDRGAGPLQGLRVLEFEAQGPVPFAGMLLADMGADLITVERGSARSRGCSPLARGRRSIAVDLKAAGGVAVALRLIERSDVLIEGFRPGVMERLGLGPDVCMARNGRLIYGRMTGWGQSGPQRDVPGHDINYIALTGALAAIGPREGPPVPPLALVGDFGGGGMLLAFGVLCGVLEARASGVGQVVDAAMVDGVSLLLATFLAFRSSGDWTDERGSNLVDGGAPFYGVYECSDGNYVALGAIEPRFYDNALDVLGLSRAAVPPQLERASWPAVRSTFEGIFRTRTRAEWCSAFDGVETCFAPVLALGEAPAHPHHVERETHLEIDGIVQPAPAPRFSRTPGKVGPPASAAGAHSAQILAELGYGQEDVARLQASGVLVAAGSAEA